LTKRKIKKASASPDSLTKGQFVPALNSSSQLTLSRINKNYEGGKITGRRSKGDVVVGTSHYPLDKVGPLYMGNQSTAHILKARGSIDVLPSINRKMPKKKLKRSA